MTTRAKGRPPIPEADRDEAARLIWAGYMDFLLGGPPPGEEAADPKAFAGRHAAGKAALAHLDQLYKLAGGPGGEAAAGRRGGGGERPPERRARRDGIARRGGG